MKILRMFAAIGLMVASVGTATVADAQHRGDRYEQRYERGPVRGVRNDRRFRDDRGTRGFRDDRGRRSYRGDRGRRGYRNDYRGNRCRVERHRGRSVRVCR